MARKHVQWRESGNGLCGKPILPTKPRDFHCNNCTSIQGVMRAVEMGFEAAELNARVFPHGNNACRIECDTATPEFRKFAALMRKGLPLHGTDTLYSFSVRGQSADGAYVRHMAA